MLCSNCSRKTENGLERGFVKGPVIIYRLRGGGGGEGGGFGAKQGEI